MWIKMQDMIAGEKEFCGIILLTYMDKHCMYSFSSPANHSTSTCTAYGML